MGKRILLIILSAVFFVTIQPALAARNAQIDVDGVEVREGPGYSFGVAFKLRKGTAVLSSNLPTDGFYKIRTGSGMVGWVLASSLVLADIDGNAAAQEEGEPEAGAPESETTRATKANEKSVLYRGMEAARVVSVRGFGSMNFYNSSEANALLRMNGLQSGLGYGCEVTARLYKKLWVAGRYEYMFKNVNGTDSSTGLLTRFAFTSRPMMGGLSFQTFEEDGVTGEISVLGGYASATTLSVTDSTGAITTLAGGSVLTGLAKLNANFMLSKWFGAFLDVGYRYLKTPQKLSPSVANSAAEIFKVNGAYVPVNLDMSGVIASVGLVFTVWY